MMEMIFKISVVMAGIFLLGVIICFLVLCIEIAKSKGKEDNK